MTNTILVAPKMANVAVTTAARAGRATGMHGYYLLAWTRSTRRGLVDEYYAFEGNNSMRFATAEEIATFKNIVAAQTLHPDRVHYRGNSSIWVNLSNHPINWEQTVLVNV